MAEKFIQPDPRISVDHIGVRDLLGKQFAVHDYPGCPVNATIEVADTTSPHHLRCWACKRALTPMAANHVLAHFQKTDRGTFIVP